MALRVCVSSSSQFKNWLYVPALASRGQRVAYVRYASSSAAPDNNTPPENKNVKPASAKDLMTRFDDIHKIRTAEQDVGAERHERLTRQQMKRVARFTGDFSSLEEEPVLYGSRGTLKEPVLVPSIFPSRTVGCAGSEDTQLHTILWHVVKREKPCICLECGQVFKLVTPPGEQMVERHHH
eukprot:TRINITY_DN25270_c0_g1_i1.p1 TRINITY_DN25270_c0_g1~~TRINITY_DN25270_c0_g1_i1.p1  ORF type:complete len:181 (-),score=22.87 TRINITY_DN25270_c0_g1_i1:67-609(-)